MIQLLETPKRNSTHAASEPLALVGQLLTRLHASSVRYCHWKSNQSLPEALTGVGDLDLLVHHDDAGRFESILARLGFKLFTQPPWQCQSSVVHYFGHDVATGKLLHLHVYWRLVTGGHLLKNYRLPLESMLLERKHLEHGVQVADRDAELAVFVVRKLLEAGGWTELLLQQRDLVHVQRELAWLLPNAPHDRAARVQCASDLIAQHLPQLEPTLWRRGAAMLDARPSLLRQHLLGQQFRHSLRDLASRGRVATGIKTSGVAVRLVGNRLRRRPSRKWPVHGGSVVALVGPEASGKSTYCASLCEWLSSALDTCSLHLGKPTISVLGRLANVMRRVRRAAVRVSQQEQTGKTGARRGLYVFASLVLARDRYRLAMRAYRAAASGTVVICDRYPSPDPGAVDGPRLLCSVRGGSTAPRWLQWAARVEQGYYRRIPPPDVVLQLSVPVSVAQTRNRHREKVGKEDNANLVQRHQQFHAGRHAHRNKKVVDTQVPLNDALREMRQLVWRSL